MYKEGYNFIYHFILTLCQTVKECYDVYVFENDQSFKCLQQERIALKREKLKIAG
jgi:hypothetical protein